MVQEMVKEGLWGKRGIGQLDAKNFYGVPQGKKLSMKKQTETDRLPAISRWRVKIRASDQKRKQRCEILEWKVRG